jgi:hypothetical protein
VNLAESISAVGPELQAIQGELFCLGKSNYKNYLHFHTKFPQVYLLFERFAMQLINSGHTKLGSKMIMERIRWEISTGGAKDSDGFKINNNYTAYYSREFIKNHPEYMEYFEFRVIRKM